MKSSAVALSVACLVLSGTALAQTAAPALAGNAPAASPLSFNLSLASDKLKLSGEAAGALPAKAGAAVWARAVPLKTRQATERATALDFIGQLPSMVGMGTASLAGTVPAFFCWHCHRPLAGRRRPRYASSCNLYNL